MSIEAQCISFAVSQVKGQKGEDRFSARLSHSNPQEGGLKNVASFGVFDGHSSCKAAQEVAKRLNNQIVLSYAELLATTGLVGTLREDPNEFITCSTESVNGSPESPDQDALDYFSSGGENIGGSDVSSDVWKSSQGREGMPRLDSIDDSSHSTTTVSTTITATINGIVSSGCRAGERSPTQPPPSFSPFVASLLSSSPTSSPKTSSHSPSIASKKVAYSSMVPPSSSSREERKNMLDSVIRTAKQMRVHEAHDAMLVESILKETYKVDKAVKDMTTSGTTSVTLILRKQANGSVRAMCANIGDSRCVCVTAVPTMAEAQTEEGGSPSRSGSTTASSTYQTGSPYHELLAARTSPTEISGIIQEFVGSGDGRSESTERGDLPEYLCGVRTTVSTAFLMSEDHNLTLPRERMRIMSRTLPPWLPLPVESFEPYLPVSMRSGLLLTGTNEPVSIFEIGALIGRKANPYPSQREPEMEASVSSSFDSDSARPLAAAPKWNSSLHLSAMVERENELETEIVRRTNLSGDALNESSGHSSGNSPELSARKSLSADKSTLFENSNVAGVLGIGNVVMTRHARASSKYYIETAASRQALASKFIKKVRGLMSRYGTKSTDLNSMTTKLTSARSINELNIIEDKSEGGSAVEDTVELDHEESFIARRVSSDGRTMGPEALFGRRNVSIMMTRSIGDKIGPRSCVAFPEISSVTIPAGKHARFVLASDGFWDVVGIESVRLAALSKNFKSSKVLADWLAQKAVRRRSRGGLRQDDVTVVVVDINFENFVHLDRKTGTKVHNLRCHRDGTADKLPKGRQCSVS